MELWSMFPIANFPFICRNIPAAHALHMEYIFLNWCDIPELLLPIRISLIEDCCKNNATEPEIPIGKHHFESLLTAIMTWLNVMEYLCHIWQLICSVYCC